MLRHRVRCRKKLGSHPLNTRRVEAASSSTSSTPHAEVRSQCRRGVGSADSTARWRCSSRPIWLRSSAALGASAHLRRRRLHSEIEAFGAWCCFSGAPERRGPGSTYLVDRKVQQCESGVGYAAASAVAPALPTSWPLRSSSVAVVSLRANSLASSGASSTTPREDEAAPPCWSISHAV